MTTSEISINPTELAIVGEILSRFVPEREVIAFGSRVKGRTKEFSDLDLAILGQEPIPSIIMADLREAFVESDLPFKVDLVDWSTTSPAFREIIQERYSTVTKHPLNVGS